MKYITQYEYVDLETGEVTELKHKSKHEEDKSIIIIKTTKKTDYGTYSKRIVTITKYYRRNKYKQTKLY